MKLYTVKRPSQIIDTTGCGDAFVGGRNIIISSLQFINHLYAGFLAYQLLNSSIDDCINAACYCAYECLSQTGCQFTNKCSFNQTQRFCNI